MLSKTGHTGGRPHPANCSPASTPPPESTPSTPPPLDFTTIDTAEKAALLPSLNPATLMFAQNALAASTQNLEALNGALNATIDASTSAQIQYTIPDPQLPCMQMSGTIGGAPFQETWTPTTDGSGTVNIVGNAGSSAENLQLTTASDGQHLDGTVGNLDIHYLIAQSPDNSQASIWTGTIGDRQMSELVSVRDDGDDNPVVHQEGTLGKARVSLQASYADPDAPGNTWTVSQTGIGRIGNATLQYQDGYTLSAPPPPA